MRVFQNPFEAGKCFPGAVVAIGKFDALHVGHKKVIGAAVKKAKSLKAPCVVLTFDPAADQFLRLYAYQPVLPLAKRIELLKEWGVDGVALLPFTKELACLSPQAFAKDILTAQIKPRCVFVGEDFCFGKDRAGRVQTLEELGPKLGFSVHPVPLVVLDGKKVSATQIRELLDQGDKAAAQKLLGRKL